MTHKSIIIDAAHKEETRVVVLENNALQDYDREAISVKKIKGNIYLAKVTRVEPSLQAAFVDYGSEKHGFLPFGDIHPEYYNLGDEEKQKLQDLYAPEEACDSDSDENSEDSATKEVATKQDEGAISSGSYSVEDETEGSYGGNIHNIHKKFNIQDVIKPGQLVLVQATKEERGNKGASMTTFVSLAGKYCVLMANTPNKGGVSRKVDNYRDRKILKAILKDLAVEKDRSIIIRTAGVGKKPEDIKRDCEYLNRLRDSINDVAMKSEAPSFIHGEDDVIKRCLRDVYSDEISEVIIEGEEAYEKVSQFIKLTMPSGNHNIKLHKERTPVFNKYKVEQQIAKLYEKEIMLKSGASIVMDHTEALVAIDVNSGKSTKESNVEETAYQTNLEAAKEVAKQLRLRDLAGLIVIDFIDMYDQKHRRHVERTLRDELQNDRARIQLGRISTFGLLELSRQRLGASLFETITQPCSNCNGTGYVRSVEILAVSILRAIRYACNDKQTGVIYIYTKSDVITYMSNFKKRDILSTEQNYNIHIFFHVSDDVSKSGFVVKKRKSLSLEEKREIEMEVITGKVNQLDLQKEYFDSDETEEDDLKEVNHDNNQDRSNNRNKKPRNNRTRSNSNNRRKGGSNNSYRKKPVRKKNKGVLSSIFGNIFKK